MLKIYNVTNILFYIQCVQTNIAEIFIPQKQKCIIVLQICTWRLFLFLFMTKKKKHTHKQHFIIIIFLCKFKTHV